MQSIFFQCFQNDPNPIIQRTRGCLEICHILACFRCIGNMKFEDMKAGIIKILENSAFLAHYEVSADHYGFTWVVIDSDSLNEPPPVITPVHGLHRVAAPRYLLWLNIRPRLFPR